MNAKQMQETSSRAQEATSIFYLLFVKTKNVFENTMTMTENFVETKILLNSPRLSRELSAAIMTAGVILCQEHSIFKRG